jgi:hypothetical protein
MLESALARPSCLDRVPEPVEAFLSTCPLSPGGVHQWLATATHRTYAYLDAAEQERVLRWAIRDCGREPQPSEIERTVENIRRKRGSGEGQGQYYKPWPSPVPKAIDEIVCHGPKVSELNNRSVYRLRGDETPAFWLSVLFSPALLLCVSREIHRLDGFGDSVLYRVWQTRRRDSWIRDAILGRCSLLVPNPASYTWHYALAGHRSTRCEAMFKTRLYQVIEFDFSLWSRDGSKETAWAPWIRKWEKGGRSVKDTCAGLLWHLSQYAPMVLVVWSGGKSLQGWFNAQGEDEASQRRFMEYACALGADSVTWKCCQLIRLPGGVRGSNGNRQTVEYFNPDNLPTFLNHSH